MDIEKLRRKKFIRNIIIGSLALAAVAWLLNVAPGYKRDTFTDVTNLVLNEENITEELTHDIYISDQGVVYLSEEDVKNLFDSTIYYDEKYDKIITTSETKVATMAFGQSAMVMNDVVIDTLDTIILLDNMRYIPISEMGEVYNIEVSYINETDILVIDNLSKGMIIANVRAETELKFKPRALSKKVTTLEEGETVSCFYTTSKGWRQIRRENGETGFVKANMLTNEHILRQDIIKKEKAESITVSSKGTARIDIDGTKTDIMTKELFKIVEQGDIEIDLEVSSNTDTTKYEIWTTISNKGIEKQLDIFLLDYRLRNELINKIVNVMVENELKGVNIDFKNVKSNSDFERFIIELTPRLRDIELYTCVKVNKDIDKEKIETIVDYIIE